jgi:dTDP-4-amino-4,6-dideoxygalactose transaminase
MARFAVPLFDLRAAHRELGAALDAVWARLRDTAAHTLGPEVEAFETDFARYCGTRHGIGVACGLDALALILRAAAIGPGDEVILPVHGFVAPWLAVAQCGATPVGVDCEPDGFNLDPVAVEAAVTPATRAILAVHLYGHPAAMAPLRAIAARHDLRLIEDAAQAHGARWRGRPAGSLGDAAAFSFFPSKNLGALGDGGAVTTSDDAIADHVRRARHYGQGARYVHVADGRNSRLDPLQAAILRVKLDALDTWQARRRAVAQRYLREIAHPDIVLPRVADGVDPAWHLFVVRARDRAGVQRRLADAAVESVVHYPIPCHRQPVFATLPHRVHGSARADRLADEVLSLPIGPHLGGAQIDRVIDAVNRRG